MKLAQHIGGGALTCLLAGPLVLSASATQPAEAGEARAVSAGSQVTLELTLKLADESVVYSNVGSEPLTITQGTEQVVPGLEQALEGMHVGEEKQVTVQPNKGFGVVHPDNFQEVSKDEIPPDLLQEGAELQGEGPHGKTVFFRIAEVKGETVVLDFNHPLAGKTLYFDVKVLDIQ